jgi:hypothetical protein
MLSILGTEHARKCLKVEYLSRIKYDFQKSRVTGPWDHKDSASAKKVKTKISCLCTFNCAEINGNVILRSITKQTVNEHNMGVVNMNLTTRKYHRTKNVLNVKVFKTLMFSFQKSSKRNLIS